MFHLVDSLSEVLLSEKTLFDDTSSPNTVIAYCFDVAKISAMLLTVHVLGYVRSRFVVLDVGLVFFHPRASISRCFADVYEITVFARDLVNDILGLLGFIAAFLQR